MMKTMRELIEAAAEETRNSGEMIGMSERWMILPEEMTQLGISEDEWPLMAAAYDAYLAFMDIVDPQAVGFDDVTITAERERSPACLNPDCVLSMEDFSLLANAWVDMSPPQAKRAYAKMQLRNAGYFP